MHIDRGACESGAIACDDRIDVMSNGSGNNYVVLEIWAAPLDSIAKDVASNRQYVEGIEAGPNDITLGSRVLAPVPSYKVRKRVNIAGQCATLDSTVAIRFPDRHCVGEPFLPFQEEVGKHVDVEKNLHRPP